MKYLILSLLLFGNLTFAQTDAGPEVSGKSVYIIGKSTNNQYTNVRTTGLSTLNSTSGTLTASGTFTGAFEDVLGFTNIGINIFTDQASAVDGLVIEYSSDGVNVDSDEKYTISANSGSQYSFGVLARYFRLRYANGPVSQTVMRLQTIYHTAAPKPSSHRIDDNISGQNDAELSKAVITSKKENGGFDNIGASNSGGLKVAITDRPSEVRNRVRVEKQIFRSVLTPSNTLVHTVTAGKTFYLTSFVMSSINEANAIGEFRLRDGNTDKLGFVTGEKITGAAAPSTAQSPNLPEPIPFTTAVNLYEISGDMQVSFYIVGYEEPN